MHVLIFSHPHVLVLPSRVIHWAMQNSAGKVLRAWANYDQ